MYMRESVVPSEIFQRLKSSGERYGGFGLARFYSVHPDP
jgi:hypothetical protein